LMRPGRSTRKSWRAVWLQRTQSLITQNRGKPETFILFQCRDILKQYRDTRILRGVNNRTTYQLH
jgi:hypothetical protein